MRTLLTTAPSVPKTVRTIVVNRIANAPKVQYSSENIGRNQYEPIGELRTYSITFSKGYDEIFIDPGSIHGHILENEDGDKEYELDRGTFAGGKFIVTENDDSLGAELTIYGSGVPIIKSERGFLESNKKISGK